MEVKVEDSSLEDHFPLQTGGFPLGVGMDLFHRHQSRTGDGVFNGDT